MIVLGLLMIVLAGAAVIAVSWDETATATTPASFTVFDQTIQLSQLEFFFAGAITGAVFLLGLSMIFSGMRRASEKRRRFRETKLETRERVARLEAEKRELERKLEETPDTVTTAHVPERRTPVSDRDGDGVADRAPVSGLDRHGVAGRAPALDRDRDGIDDRNETTAPHPRVDVPQQSSADRLVAGRHGRHETTR
ncbi:hypothetical protein ACFYSC_26270 [Streptosporangium sp. NPDC004379]|uniref:hypothetical protein n=1 Tax=Streptosporangium sp. NPDC004379 TaxID=3366189 RepID=UPI00368A5667